MTRSMFALLSLTALTIALGNMTTPAQEKRASDKTTSQTKAKVTSVSAAPAASASGSKAAAAVSRRLPTGFSSLDLTDEQKERIFAIRAEHTAQITDLEQQIQKIRQQMDKQSNSVLTAAQKKMLAARNAEPEEVESGETAPAATTKPVAKTKSTPADTEDTSAPAPSESKPTRSASKKKT